MIAVEINKCRPKVKFPIIAWLIMILQGMAPWNKTSWSHMSLSYTSITGNKKFIDATGTLGVTERIASRFAKKYTVIESMMFTPEINETQFQHWVESQEGKMYDHGQIAGLLMKILGLTTINVLGDNFKKLTCNELVITYLNEFHNADIFNSDQFDLNMTWVLARTIGSTGVSK